MAYDPVYSMLRKKFPFPGGAPAPASKGFGGTFSVTPPRAPQATGAPAAPTSFQPATPAYSTPASYASSPAGTGIRDPGETLTSAERRTQARENYGIGLGDVNRRLMQAAFDYGGSDSVQQYGLTDTGADNSYAQSVGKNPNSAIANIDRYGTEHRRGIDEDLNNRNSFFSGAHIKQQRDLTDETGRQRLSAEQDYARAMAQLNQEIINSRMGRDAQFRMADIEDILAAQAATPQPGADTSSPGTPVPVESPAPAAPQPNVFGIPQQPAGTWFDNTLRGQWWGKSRRR
jgi:hypothetical protein